MWPVRVDADLEMFSFSRRGALSMGASSKHHTTNLMVLCVLTLVYVRPHERQKPCQLA